MKIVSVKEMREIDRVAIKELGIPGVVLMENAGQGVVSAMDNYFDSESIDKVTIVCGKGNNGGDGFVVARYLMNQNIGVDVYIVGDVSSITGDAKTNLDIIKGMGVKPRTIRNKIGVRNLMLSFSDSDVIVDAIFGTGFSGSIHGIVKDVIREINESTLRVVAVDTPSGIDSVTGNVTGEAVMADLTVTMELPKTGQFLYPGKHYVGELYIVALGFPEQVIEGVSPRGTLVDTEVVRRFMPWRAPNLHKGTFGRVLIVAGSTGMTGAAAMASTAALRAGAGLVYLAIPEHLNPVLETKCTEVITVPVPQTADGSISLEAYDTIMEKASKVDVMAIGPGMSRHPETEKLVRKIVEDVPIPLLIDADGINALAGHTTLLKKRKRPTILTPHPGEMSRLINTPVKEIEKERIAICSKYASKWSVILALKGVPTIIAKQDGAFWLNPYVNSGLATAGSGDVLTGLIIGFLAQKTTPLTSAVSGVYIHSLAGEILRKKMGEYSIIAGDLIDAISEAIMHLFS